MSAIGSVPGITISGMTSSRPNDAVEGDARGGEANLNDMTGRSPEGVTGRL